MSKMGRPLAMPADDRRREILNVAEQLFGEKGYENVTMNEIAIAAGMSKKTLYVYFADKKELLKSLVTSSYLWSKPHYEVSAVDTIDQLKQHLKLVAGHVLSDRHIKLCRLAIGESVGNEELSQTFYELGIVNSRDSLISVAQKILPEQCHLALPAEMIVDMIFGAAIGRHFFDFLFSHKIIDMELVNTQIEELVQQLFKN